MDIRIMEYYLAVVREGNISAAAEKLSAKRSGEDTCRGSPPDSPI